MFFMLNVILFLQINFKFLVFSLIGLMVARIFSVKATFGQYFSFIPFYYLYTNILQIIQVSKEMLVLFS